jgi:hypothetical protein
MMETKKTKEQLRQDTIDALDLFIKNLKEFLRNGNYEIYNIDRDIETEEVDGISLKLNDHKLIIRRRSTDIFFTLKMNINDVLSPELLNDYNRLSIDNDIRYYEEELMKLKVQKANLVKAALQKKGEDEVVS